jgi:arylsulfatase A-like enzyme
LSGWPPLPHPPVGAPNIVIVVLDDTGFGDLGCYGGLGGRVATPYIYGLASAGLIYNNFHVNSMCSATRAALLTGRNHHAVGVGSIMELASGFPGYNGRIPKAAAMLPSVLGAEGYTTMALGKWHLTPVEDITPIGPFERWPLGQGFGRFYGFMGAETDQYRPELYEDNHSLPEAPPRHDGDYHLSEDLVDHAIAWTAEHGAVAPGRPFFCYLA